MHSSNALEKKNKNKDSFDESYSHSELSDASHDGTPRSISKPSFGHRSTSSISSINGPRQFYPQSGFFCGVGDEELPRVAYIYASPLTNRVGVRISEVDQLDIRKEVGLIRNMLAESKRLLAFRVEVATSQNLRMLVTLGCRMLHYAGHGSSDNLCFENSKGEVHALGVEKLKRLFEAGGVRTQVVFVSACHSESAGRAFADAGVPHVVAVKTEARVSDQASRTFAQSFYLPLFMGQTVLQAFEIAVNSVEADFAGSSAGNKFLLLPSNGNHDVAPFSDVNLGAFYDETLPLPANTCDKPPAHFLGRNIKMQEIFEHLQTGRRCVTIMGEPGVGKTALALRLCVYINERRLFEAGIYFVPLARAQGPLGRTALFLQLAKALDQEKKANVTEESEVIAQLQRLMGPDEDKRLLLVLDGADFLGSTEEENSPVSLISSLLLRTKGLFFLVTACNALLTPEDEGDNDGTNHNHSVQLENEAEKVVHLGPLSPIAAANLLLSLSPRKLKMSEMKSADSIVSPQQPGNSPSGGNPFLMGLSQHPVLKALKGNPRAIARFAPSLQNQELDVALVGRAENILANALVPSRPDPLKRQHQSEDSTLSIPPSPSEPETPTSSLRNSVGKKMLETESLNSSLSERTKPEELHPDDEFGPENQGGEALSKLAKDMSTLDFDALRNHPVKRRQRSDTDLSRTSCESGNSQVDLTKSKSPSRMQSAVRKHLSDHPIAADIWVRLCQNSSDSDLSRSASEVSTIQNTLTWEALVPELQQWLRNVLCSVPEDPPWLKSTRLSPDSRGTPGLVSCGAMQDLTNKADESWSSKQIRLLSEEDLEYVRQKVAPDGLVHFANFRDFCRNWWEPLLVTVRRLRHEWNSESPRLILGFIDRKSAENLLQNSREGTFLIRFSDTKAGWLAITFTLEIEKKEPELSSESCVQHVLVDVQADGCVISFLEKGKRKYSTLQSLIQDSKGLNAFYPQVDKQTAFVHIPS